MKYIIKQVKFNDMALSQSDAMNRCIYLGELFIKHFHKIYNNPQDINVNHWSKEMQGWLKSVKKIILKHNNKPIPENKLRDWFFTAGSNPDNIEKMNYTELQCYNRFITQCLMSEDVKSSLGDIIK